MAGQRSPSLYELLEVGSAATFEEIEQSYQRMAAYLGSESLAVYSILDSDDVHSARAQIDEAYRTLSDPDRRAAYDRSRKEDAGYPSMMVPAASGGSTSTADADIGEHGGSGGQAERDKRLPVTGRSQARQPIRGPGARTGRAPLYGRDVGRSSKPNEPAAAEPKKNPRYGRAQPVGATTPERPAEPVRRQSEPERTTARWSTREDDEERYDAPLPPVTRQLRDEPEHEDEQHVEVVARSAPPQREEKRHEPPMRQEPTRSDAALRNDSPFGDERPELVKTVSDVVEPRKRPTLPPPAQLSASAKAKKRLLSPSIAMELTGDVEYGGSLLRRLRESTGASLDEVAEITKVGKRHLIAIETNDFAALPAAVYTRGFVAEYARVLGLDVARVTKSFMALYAKYRGVGG